MAKASNQNRSDGEGRKLGEQNGLDTLVVPFVTSNDGLSVVVLRYYLDYWYITPKYLQSIIWLVVNFGWLVFFTSI